MPLLKNAYRLSDNVVDQSKITSFIHDKIYHYEENKQPTYEYVPYSETAQFWKEFERIIKLWQAFLLRKDAKQGKLFGEQDMNDLKRLEFAEAIMTFFTNLKEKFYGDQPGYFYEHIKANLEALLFLANHLLKADVGFCRNMFLETIIQLQQCGPGIFTSLEDIVYKVQKKEGFYSCLEASRLNLVDGYAHRFFEENKKAIADYYKTDIETAEASYKMHIVIAFRQYANDCKFGIPTGSSLGQITDHFKFNLKESDKRKFLNYFNKAYNQRFIVDTLASGIRESRDNFLNDTSYYGEFYGMVQSVLKKEFADILPNLSINDIVSDEEDTGVFSKDDGFDRALEGFCEKWCVSNEVFSRAEQHKYSLFSEEKKIPVASGMLNELHKRPE